MENGNQPASADAEAEPEPWKRTLSEGAQHKSVALTLGALLEKGEPWDEAEVDEWLLAYDG